MSGWFGLLQDCLGPFRTKPDPVVITQYDDCKPVHVDAKSTYVFGSDCFTRAGHTHRKGELLYVERETTETPFNEVGPDRVNWWCRTRYGVSIWATLESCIARGILRRLD